MRNPGDVDGLWQALEGVASRYHSLSTMGDLDLVGRSEVKVQRMEPRSPTGEASQVLLHHCGRRVRRIYELLRRWPDGPAPHSQHALNMCRELANAETLRRGCPVSHSMAERGSCSFLTKLSRNSASSWSEHDMTGVSDGTLGARNRSGSEGPHLLAPVPGDWSCAKCGLAVSPSRCAAAARAGCPEPDLLGSHGPALGGTVWRLPGEASCALRRRLRLRPAACCPRRWLCGGLPAGSCRAPRAVVACAVCCPHAGGILGVCRALLAMAAPLPWRPCPGRSWPVATTWLLLLLLSRGF